MISMVSKRNVFCRRLFVLEKYLKQFIFRANFNANAANAASTYVLEVVLHILGAFFRVEISLPVRRRFFTENRASGASSLTNHALAASVFDDGKFRLQGCVRQNGGKAYFTAVVDREEKPAFPHEPKPR